MDESDGFSRIAECISRLSYCMAYVITDKSRLRGKMSLASLRDTSSVT